MRRTAARLVLAFAWLLLAQPAAAQRTDTNFAATITRLSEPGGYFDTDNLISNESSYLHALDVLRRTGVRGGAYIGVGPDQNFSYIAQIRPSVAYVIDIRRDNLLEHLMFKALFALASDRAQYLSLLIGRPAPQAAAAWRGRSPEILTSWFDRTPPNGAFADSAVNAVRRTVAGFGLDLAADDMRTIERFHRAFIAGGLDLQFNSFNRAPQAYYPTLRRLILEKDRAGNQAGYLASDSAFEVVRALQQRNAVIPVVGDLAGSKALAAIGRDISRRGEQLGTFYTSNVEFYLMNGGTFASYAATTSNLPWARNGVIIRSYFSRFDRNHPNAVPGYASIQLVEPAASFIRETRGGGYMSYRELVTKNILH